VSDERDPFEVLRAAPPFHTREDHSVEPAEAADRVAPGPTEITDPEQIAILEEATAVLDELNGRRPGLRTDVKPPRTVAQCYRYAGEPQAAEAWERIASIVGD